MDPRGRAARALAASPVQVAIMPDADAPLIPGYTLLRKLGEGNYGAVWEARDDAGFPAALKLIDRNGSLASQLELDALQALTRLRHRHLVRTFTSFDVGHRVVIVMELAEGTLEQRLRYCVEAEGLPGIPPAELLHYLRQVASAVDYLHARKIIHRDIKPENLLLLHDSEPYVALGDCGLLRRQRGEDELATVIGTPAYMSPEVWAQRAGPAGDRYNLAITYVELRRGRRPFTGPDSDSVRRAHQEEEPDLTGLEEREAEVVRRALAKDPSRRHETCEEFVEELERALGVQAFRFRAARVGLKAKPAKSGSAAKRPPAEAGPPHGTHKPSLPRAAERDSPPTVALPASLPASLPATLLYRPSSARRVFGGLVGVLAAVLLAGVIWWLLKGPKAGGPLLVPDGFRAAEGSERVALDGRDYASCLIAEKAGDGVRFRLLTPRDGEKENPAPFYLMEDKVTNGLYRAFAAERPEQAGASWRKGGRRGGEDAGSGDDALPALRMTRPQAEAFARWLGGRLPGCAEFDRAAAWRDGRKPAEGPFRSGRLAVGRRDKGPSAVGGPDDEADVCTETNIRGLAGNGAEWTRDDIGELAALRGRSYTAPGPLRYGLLAEYRRPERRLTPTQRPGYASAYTGFRVAVDLPE
jgi:serine/threonine protein kinase